jgi:hypothetical protein
MTGVWIVVDTNGHPVIETTDRFEAEDNMRPGYGLEWEDRG